ncbi:TIGR00730 family Rossman fold protein [Paenibacillus sp. J2TS4]|uniref:LOG family protein n=1 Tax=Paenibacillus sp. J2TS4 TaxID=2807194 RepID=UPI001AFFF65A|nr:TIGR00730 family Rossman fold protein [Paenibacillus sp. J2TS4]GIP34852.1 cytokinin riboside 5'-monophosphate phosphoribohydrolase [Paenibacillus sp. J2TS4]
MKRVCVYAGSNPGNDPAYEKAAIQLGIKLAERGLELVYGGSSVGLMGRIANSVLNQEGGVIGVMPTGLFRGEVVHTGLTQLYEVNGMHERKAKMGELSDAFIALPGGYGTLEEVFEIVSWGQLGIHSKPVGLLNINGYYQPLVDMVNNGVEAGFIPAPQSKLLIVEDDPDILLDRLASYEPPKGVNKWSELPPI